MINFNVSLFIIGLRFRAVSSTSSNSGEAVAAQSALLQNLYSTDPQVQQAALQQYYGQYYASYMS